MSGNFEVSNSYQLADGSIVEDKGPEIRVLSEHFAMIPRWVFQAVGPRGLQCYTAIMLYANWQGEKKSAWPSKKKLASDMRVSESTVDLAIKELRDAGVLVVERRTTPDGGTTSNNYWLITQESQRGASVEEAYALWQRQNFNDGGGCVSPGGGGYQSAPRGVTSQPLTRTIEQESFNNTVLAAPKKKTTVRFEPLSIEQLAKLKADFSDLPVEDEIAMARAHVSHSKWKVEYLGLRKWLSNARKFNTPKPGAPRPTQGTSFANMTQEQAAAFDNW